MWYFNLWSINLTSRLDCLTTLILDLLGLLLLLYRWFLMYIYLHNFLLEGFLSKRSHESIAFISEFSESLREMGACLLEKTALNDDEESGKWTKFYHVFIWWHYLKKLYPFRWFIVFCICFLVHPVWASFRGENSFNICYSCLYELCSVCGIWTVSMVLFHFTNHL